MRYRLSRIGGTDERMTDETFGDWLSVELGRHDWSQRKFAEMIGVANGTVSRWIRDADVPQGAQIISIAKALGVKPALVLSHFPNADPLDEDEMFYANISGNLTDEEKRGVLAYLRGMRGNSE